MVHFFQKSDTSFFAIGSTSSLEDSDINKLSWLLSGATYLSSKSISGYFIGPRKEMITPWSTNAVEITANCGISGISRLEYFELEKSSGGFDPMLQQKYVNLDQEVFTLDIAPESIQHITDLSDYNSKQGLALNGEEIAFLDHVAKEIGRSLTDSEVFGFSQINSEHCRHKIFNGHFIIDEVEHDITLFEWIKKTSKENPNLIVSAYKDNVAFISGPVVEQFAPETQDKPDYFCTSDINSVISLKAETHNFPTTVEPFNGAATGSGGEIRDRMAGGQGSLPLAGTAVYITSYPRSKSGRSWEAHVKEREWLYQTPQEILIKASNGASDYGNKFGQPLICGSVLTFEHEENGKTMGYDKVIMLAGGVGLGKVAESKKLPVKPGQKIVVLGGDNYRIGMGGGAVSSVNTGEFKDEIELNAVQRSNPEMQKRVANAIRAMVELEQNPVISIHDHGAGGHLNCLSELIEDSGGTIHLDKLPIGDPTLSDKEIMSNESQERMGLIIQQEDVEYLRKVSERERAPYFEVGESDGSQELIFENKQGAKPFDLKLHHLFGASPTTILKDKSQAVNFKEMAHDPGNLSHYLSNVLRMEAVACKDWLTNKVDRSVTGKVALQQTIGEIQLPLNDVSIMALDFKQHKGVATSIGHSPVPGLVNAGAGSRLSVAEALTNLVFAPLTHSLDGVSLSANWMWPAKNPGENARLYQAVQELSEFAIELGINIPTGKDSLSMTQKYPDGQKVLAPGTVIISTVAEVSDIRKAVSPALKPELKNTSLYYIDFSGGPFELGGSSLAQSESRIGTSIPDVKANILKESFELLQELIHQNAIISGHDISAGGLITTLLEMNFPNAKGGMDISLNAFDEHDLIKLLFSEKPAIVVQVDNNKSETLLGNYPHAVLLGTTISERHLKISQASWSISLDINTLRDTWMESSFLLDRQQNNDGYAEDRNKNYKQQTLHYQYDPAFTGSLKALGINLDRKTRSGTNSAIIREKGVNGDREMAYSLWMAGFDVKDVHMTDLISGREDLSKINLIVFVGGFSNSDVLGSAKGWAGSFLFNPKAKKALDDFYQREDTLSLGVCNGCQVMMELEKIYPEKTNHPKMNHNGSGKFESTFINVDILANETIMFKSLAGSRLGIWVAHGEGRFMLPENESEYNIPVKYSYESFPGNPNSSDHAAAAVASKDGRHVAIMPHLERSIFPWNWPHYEDKLAHEVTPWIAPFMNARKWIEKKLES